MPAPARLRDFMFPTPSFVKEADYTCPVLRGRHRFGRFAAAELRLTGLSPIIHIRTMYKGSMR